MQYRGAPASNPGAAPRLGVLLTNLGSPSAPTPAAVRDYLVEFLTDPRVIELPRALWRLVLHGIVLRVRPRRVAKLYGAIWTEDGAPLLAISRRQAQAVQHALMQSVGENPERPVHVMLGMRYGSPSIAEALRALQRAGLDRLLVLPLYPQYSASTVGSTFDALSRELSTWRQIPALVCVHGYHDFAPYLDALAASVRQYIQTHGLPERLLISFHGLPQRYVDAGDPYAAQCAATAAAIAQRLNLPQASWQWVYQSRFGREPWLQPYLDHTLRALAQSGVRRVAVVCPGFAADCLETLEEVAVQNRELFLRTGGERYDYIPALNTDPAHIAALCALIGSLTSG